MVIAIDDDDGDDEDCDWWWCDDDGDNNNDGDDNDSDNDDGDNNNDGDDSDNGNEHGNDGNLCSLFRTRKRTSSFTKQDQSPHSHSPCLFRQRTIGVLPSKTYHQPIHPNHNNEYFVCNVSLVLITSKHSNIHWVFF